MRRTPRSFSKEFKLHIIQQVEAGTSQACLARQYAISPVVISRWVGELATFGADAFSGNGKAHSVAARVGLLERDNARLRAENELLKKALGCAPGSPGSTPESGADG